MRLHEGIDPCIIVGAVAMADAEMLCNGCADKEAAAGTLRAGHTTGHSCGRCGLRFEEAAIYLPDDLPEIAAQLTLGRSVLASRHSVGPLHQALGGARLGVVVEPGGRIAFEEPAADCFMAAKMFLSLVIARQVGYPEDELTIITARDLVAGDRVFELANYEACIIENISEWNGQVRASVYAESTRKYQTDEPLVVIRTTLCTTSPMPSPSATRSYSSARLP
jgi:hypothetical protein